MAQYSSPLLDDYNRTGVVSPGLSQAMDRVKQRLGTQPDANTAPPDQQQPALGHPQEQPPAITTPGQSAPLTQQPVANPTPALTHTPTPNEARLTSLENSPSGISGMHHAAARIPLQILDAVGSAFLPGLTEGLPGTQLHHNMLVRQAEGAVKNDQGEQAAQDRSRLEQAQATNQEAVPQLKQTAAELAATKEANTELHQRATEDIGRAGLKSKEDIASGKRTATLAQHGFEENEKGEIVPLSYEKMSQEQQAVHDLKAAQSEAAEATAQLKKAQAENQPAIVALAEKRLASATDAHRIASERLGLSEKQFEMRAHGTEGGGALPGAMLTDKDKPVGTAFQQNVRPTGQERNKADLANSAHDQIEDIKSIVQKRPDIFGPVAGRKTDFTVWLGSQDPDAQRFRAARTIAGDHLAGVFGGRSEAALQALDSAIGHFKDNPQAMAAGLDQLGKANSRFQKAGTVKTAGSNATDKTLPGGITLDDIDAEIAKRKKK